MLPGDRTWETFYNIPPSCLQQKDSVPQNGLASYFSKQIALWFKMIHYGIRFNSAANLYSFHRKIDDSLQWTRTYRNLHNPTREHFWPAKARVKGKVSNVEISHDFHMKASETHWKVKCKCFISYFVPSTAFNFIIIYLHILQNALTVLRQRWKDLLKFAYAFKQQSKEMLRNAWKASSCIPVHCHKPQTHTMHQCGEEQHGNTC